MRYEKGQIILVDFPNSDLRSSKPRPALVVQASDLQTGISQVIIAMVSSQLRRAGHPSRMLIKLDSAMGQTSGLIRDSVVMTDNLATVRTDRILRTIGTIPTPSLDSAIKHTFGLT